MTDHPVTEPAAPLPAKGSAESFDSKRNWTGDFTDENGQYVNRCLVCRKVFIGHKRRVTCKLCATADLHDADCPSRDGFYPENCECSHARTAASASLPVETTGTAPEGSAPDTEGIDALLDEFAFCAARSEDAARRTDNSYVQADAELAAARSSIVKRFEEMRTENEYFRGESSGWQDIAESAERELSRLREVALTPEEAQVLGWCIEGTPYLTPSANQILAAKLRALSSPDGGGK